jgi:RimJ/RimL family protein N-acetyltransferase
MVIRLNFKEYHHARHLFKDFEKYILGITSVFEGNSKGIIVVNKKKRPTSGFIFLGKSSIFLDGDSDDFSFIQSLKTFFQTTLFSQIEEESENNFLSIYCNQTWKEKIKPMFVKTHLIRRKFYQLKSTELNGWREKLSEDYSIRFIDEDFFVNQRLKDKKSLISWIRGCWITEDNFLSKGFGFCIIFKESEIASVCLSNYFSEKLNRCEIGIYTEEKFQKQGLAKILTSEMVDYCLNRNIESIEWHTREENIASVRIADSVGFKLRKELEGFIGYF